MATKTRKDVLERRRLAMETERSSFIARWQDLNDYILPTRGRFNTAQNNKGNRSTKKIIDSSATLSARTLAGGMMSGITSPARPWFQLTVPDPDLAEYSTVQTWLYVVTKRMRQVLARSNFYRVTPLTYIDLGVFGTSGLMALEDDKTIVRFYDFPIGSFTTALDSTNRPAVLAREFQMTVEQMVQRFGIDKVSATVKAQYDRSNYEQLFDVVHFVQPNANQDENSIYAKDNKAWASCYYEKSTPVRGDSPFLRESGFDEFPCMVPRWEVTGEDVYGTNCPGMTALGDIKQLQQGEKLSLQATEKMVKPPLIGPANLRTVRVSLLPGDTTYMNEAENLKGLRPIHETRFDIQQLEGKQAQVRGRIDRAFYADLFLMLTYLDAQEGRSRQPVTAAEIYERHEEKLLALGPVLEQLNQDFLDPVIDRTFNIMLRRGFIPVPPKELQGMTLQTEYISVMHQAQKSTAAGGLRNIAQFVGEIAKIDQSALDKLNTDRLIDYMAEASGVPPDVIVPQDQVIQVRKARAAAVAKEKEAQQLEMRANAVNKLGATDTTKPSALTDLAEAAAQGGLGGQA